MSLQPDMLGCVQQYKPAAAHTDQVGFVKRPLTSQCQLHWDNYSSVTELLKLHFKELQYCSVR